LKYSKADVFSVRQIVWFFF